MACYQRKLAKGLKWYYKFDLNGNTYFSKCIYNTKSEAKKAEALAIGNANNTDRIIKTVSLYDAIQDRLHYLKQVKSAKYYVDSRRYLNGFLNSVNYDISVCDVIQYHIETYLSELSNSLKLRNKKNYAVNSAIRCLKAFFNFIIDKYMLEMKNPVKQQYFPIDKRLKYIPTDEEIDAVLEICDEGQRQLVEFVRDTGARISEALRLRYSDITDDYVVLYTRKSKHSDLTPRKVPYKFLPKRNSSDLVFSRWIDKPRFLEKKIKSLGSSHWSWHNLRHRYASKLSKDGRPLFEIMSLLGHSQLTTTQNYLQLLKD